MEELNFWGALKVPETVNTPKSILEESANGLEKQTEGLLMGEVRSSKPGAPSSDLLKKVAPKTNGNNLLVCTFRIIAPNMNNYSLDAIKITYSILELYPLYLEDLLNGKEYEVSSEKDYIELLKDIIQSPTVLQVTQSLLTQSIK